MTKIVLQANGLPFTALEQGSGDRLALLLHGFPDDPGSMLPLMSLLATKGFRTLAPYMRGYGPTPAPRSGDYRLSALSEDILALISASGHSQALVIGHDWGGLAAMSAAARQPERFLGLVSLSVPPIPCFLSNLSRSPGQLWRSRYMLFYQLPHLPEFFMNTQEMRWIESIWRRWSPQWDFPVERLEQVKDTFRTPHTLKAALGYYRDLPRTPFWRQKNPDFRVQTLILTGNEDRCIDQAMFKTGENSLAVKQAVVTGAGHFLPMEKPNEIFAEIEACFSGL